jgi:hypothetical protein
MRNSTLLFSGLWLLQSVSFTEAAPGAANDYFAIHVVDGETGRGVPLVELRTVNKVSWWTDSNGIVAFNEPGLMDGEVYFKVQSPGYEIPADFFKNRGVKLKPVRGGHAEIRIKRLNIAERLYRITGQGIYRDSLLVGCPVPLRQPALSGRVMGQDTVIATPYRGKLYWFWGDTERPEYPLENFAASGATSELPGSGGLDPALGVDLTYFVDPTGTSKAMCPLAEDGLKWIQCLFTVRDEQGAERLVARVANCPGLAPPLSWNLVLFNDQKQVFESFKHWDIHDDHNTAAPFKVKVNGMNYYYLFSDWRVPADLSSIADLSRYEAFNCLAGDGCWHGTETPISRDVAGHVQYTWKAGADRIGADRLNKLVEASKLKQHEMWFYAVDYESGAALTRGLGSVAWNDFRRRWIVFFVRENGDAWFAEADTPLGPWGYARRVLTHGDYNFYNLMHHPFFDQQGGRLVYFEGTYTAAFTKAGENGMFTPRYDYNQLMYRLALDDPRLTLPVAVYRVRETNGLTHLWLRDQVEAAGAWERIDGIAWFALPPTYRGTDCVPVYATEKGGTALSLTPPASDARALFVGLPLTESEPGTTLEGSWECRAMLPQGEEFKFSFQLTRQGESVTLSGVGPDATACGTFRDGKLTLTLKDEDGAFILVGRFDNRSLLGSWRKEGGTEKGTWSASPVDARPPERRSPALVTLREYRRSENGRSNYSTLPQPPPDSKPDGRPLCRVWKAPGTVLTLDWKARAAPTSGN